MMLHALDATSVVGNKKMLLFVVAQIGNTCVFILLLYYLMDEKKVLMLSRRAREMKFFPDHLVAK